MFEKHNASSENCNGFYGNFGGILFQNLVTLVPSSINSIKPPRAHFYSYVRLIQKTIHGLILR